MWRERGRGIQHATKVKPGIKPRMLQLQYGMHLTPHYTFKYTTHFHMVLTRRWVGPVWPGRAGVVGYWTLDHRGGWTGERLPEWSPAGKAPAAGLAAPALTRDAVWMSHLRDTNRERQNVWDKTICVCNEWKGNLIWRHFAVLFCFRKKFHLLEQVGLWL